MAAFAVACSLAFPLDRFHGGQAAVPPSDAGDADGERVPGCPLARPPPRPSANDSEEELEPIVVALRTTSASFDAGARAESVGYDLDGFCTCGNSEPPSCILGESALKCDVDGGIDNQAAEVVVALKQLPTLKFNPVEFEAYVTDGKSTVLIEVRKYNGMPNDTQVEVSLFPSSGRMRDGGDPNDLAPPNWDGKDVWTTLQAATDVFGRAKTRDQDAYVRDGILVSKLQSPPDAGLVSPQLGLTTQLQDGFLTGRIGRPDGGLWQLQSGVVAGRLSLARLLRLLSTVPDLDDPTKFVCAGSGLSYLFVKPLICKNGDISASTADDGRGLPCDAVSVGVGFEATQALRGRFGNDLPIVYGCGVDYTDSCDGGPQ